MTKGFERVLLFALFAISTQSIFCTTNKEQLCIMMMMMMLMRLQSGRRIPFRPFNGQIPCITKLVGTQRTPETADMSTGSTAVHLDLNCNLFGWSMFAVQIKGNELRI